MDNAASSSCASLLFVNYSSTFILQKLCFEKLLAFDFSQLASRSFSYCTDSRESNCLSNNSLVVSTGTPQDWVLYLFRNCHFTTVSSHGPIWIVKFTVNTMVESLFKQWWVCIPKWALGHLVAWFSKNNFRWLTISGSWEIPFWMISAETTLWYLLSRNAVLDFSFPHTKRKP